MADLKNILFLDATGKAIAYVAIPTAAMSVVGVDKPEGFTGAYFFDAQWDGEKLIDPNYTEPTDVAKADVTSSADGRPDVIS